MLSDAGNELQSESKREYVKIEKSSQNVKINFSQSVKKCNGVFYVALTLRFFIPLAECNEV